ncbi:LapA family protein [uncultured Sunxiuqinia sp.]|jgi:lipopolysaccharide assembly protein A|uniref:LapA family protein n=1 Tax=uncultured Sunxiuqinia sp. TaxID=1573825 RepID=UPI0019917CD2|nr:LapA family protein [Sunxiuqinia sp.]|tara:strand:- start:4474 stop:4809 length:336 start_codon:yes stop_codon:yes gene_type:complete
MSAGIIVLLILALLLVIFTLQNTVLITLNVFFWKITDVPLVLTLIVCIILGAVLALSFAYPKLWKLKGQLKERQRKIKELELSRAHAPEKTHIEGIEMTDENDDDSSFFKE